MNKTFFYMSLFLVSVFIGCIAQVMLKKAAMKVYESRIKEYMNFKVIFAYGLFFLTTLLSIEAYKGIPLSMGAVLQTTSYVYITIFGVIFFGEKVNTKKITALLLIISGIMLYTFVG